MADKKKDILSEPIPAPDFKVGIGEIRDKDLTDGKKRWCVDVDLVYGEDFTLRFSTEVEATAAANGFFTDGFVSRDVRGVSSHKYDTIIYPLEQVRAVRIWEDEA